MKNLTALMSSYVRAYHSANSNIRIYSDMSKEILGKDYDKITGYLSAGISYFTSDYKGLDPVNWIVNNVLAPSVLARSSFNFKHLQKALDFAIVQKLLPKINGYYKDYELLFKKLIPICDENSLKMTKEALISMEEFQRQNMGYCQYLV